MQALRACHAASAGLRACFFFQSFTGVEQCRISFRSCLPCLRQIRPRLPASHGRPVSGGDLSSGEIEDDKNTVVASADPTRRNHSSPSSAQGVVMLQPVMMVMMMMLMMLMSIL